MPIRLLDYGRPNPFRETIGRARQLAWPVNVYRVTLPKISEDAPKVNPFERVILKLIDVSALRDPNALAQQTCLPIDLVHCVLLRLRDMGYIDSYNQIVTQHRERWASKDPNPETYVTACVFRELAAGKILPYIHSLENGAFQKIEDDERFYKRIPWQDAHRKNPPTPRDVIMALRAMKKKSKAFGTETRLPAVQQIMIANEAELHYLRCPIAIQKSDGEFRIADPFGNGFSLELESAFSNLLENNEEIRQWLLNWKMNLASGEMGPQGVKHLEPYDNDCNVARYPKLIAVLRVRQQRQFRSIDQIHAALEWALFYSCAQRDCGPTVQQLKLTQQSEHPTLLQKAAEKLSLAWPDGALPPVREGKLKDFYEGKAELATVLSLSLLLAADDPSHPLRRIAATHPDLLLQLLKIKQRRDEWAHGASQNGPKDVELPEDKFMQQVVAALLPKVRFSDTVAPPSETEVIADAEMAARTTIQSEFGFPLYNRLGSNLQHRLIAAERFWLSCNDGDDALAFVCDLYAALQILFRTALTTHLPPETKESEYITAAQDKAKNCGLGDLPECFLTVKRGAVRETLLGNDQSLQSCLVAFLLVSPDPALSAIAKKHPSFIVDVARIIALRGHGNEPLPMSKADIGQVRKAAYTTIVTILEV